MKVALLTPTRDRPSEAFIDALGASVPFLDAAGYEHATVFEVGCPYISGARATMLRKAMKWGADVFVFIDDDLSWRPGDLVRLIEAEGDVVGGTYRFKLEQEEYMGNIECDHATRAITRKSDGAIRASALPAGFLKVTRAGVEKFMRHFPELVIVKDGERSPDLFNHGVIRGTWYGEDMAFSKRWKDIGAEMWLIPDLKLGHHDVRSGRAYEGDFYDYLLRQPGGSKSANPVPPDQVRTVLHVGCGGENLPAEGFAGFVEVKLDINPAMNPDIVASVTDLGEIGPFDAVYSSHCLEHLYPYEVTSALAEMLRVLKPGGAAVLIVPNCEGLSPSDRVLYTTPQGLEVTAFDVIYGHRHLIEANPHMAHHCGFTPTLLEQAMKGVGFRDVRVMAHEHNISATGRK